MFYKNLINKIMAKKKRKKAPTHHRRGLSAAGTPKRKAYRKKSKSLLSEAFTHTQMEKAFQGTVSSSVGGFAAGVADKKIIPSAWGLGGRVMTGLAVGFVGHLFGAENLASGFNGGIMAIAQQQGLLNEEESMSEEDNFADQDALNNAPMFLDEDGTPVKILEDGTKVYLSEAELNEMEEFDEYSIVE